MQFAPDSLPPLWQRLSNAVHQRLHPQTPAPTPLGADTVSNWPPEAGKVLSGPERLAYAALSSALHTAYPQGFLLAHVPLPRLVRVPSRRSYKDWLARTGHLSADFVLCDSTSRPLVVVQMAAVKESSRGQRRTERLQRVLEAAGIRLVFWQVGWSPNPATLRNALFASKVSATGPEQTPEH
ncbi:MAG: DUF2726 domain-containing protein [Burkholderiales bacterium]|jgi:hypothetical protein